MASAEEDTFQRHTADPVGAQSGEQPPEASPEEPEVKLSRK